MRKIKFRGRHVAYHDEIYYGFYEMDARGNHFIIDSNNIMHIVDPESVAQLVGLDVNGNEVYEGDIVLDECGGEWEAIIYSSITLPNEKSDDDLTVWGKGVTLKEAHHE